MQVNVCDDDVADAERLRISMSPEQPDAVIGAWIDSATDHLRRPFDELVAATAPGASISAYLVTESVPMVNTREQAEAVVRSTRYAPDGSRSWGPVMAGMRHDDNRAWADAHVATIPMIETAEAIENLDEILSVPGVDAVYVGPADLSISLGLGPYGNDGNAVFDDALTKIVAACAS